MSKKKHMHVILNIYW